MFLDFHQCLAQENPTAVPSQTDSSAQTDMSPGISSSSRALQVWIPRHSEWLWWGLVVCWTCRHRSDVLLSQPSGTSLAGASPRDPRGLRRPPGLRLRVGTLQLWPHCDTQHWLAVCFHELAWACISGGLGTNGNVASSWFMNPQVAFVSAILMKEYHVPLKICWFLLGVLVAH